jgi:hypothetical protein
VQNAVDPGHRSRRERTVTSAAGPQEMSVEVVDVGGGEFGQVEVAEVRPEVAVDDGAGVAHRGGRPVGRGGLEPSVEQISERAGADPGTTGLSHKVLELAAGEPLGAVDGLAQPPWAPCSRIGAQVDAKLPRVAAARAHRARSRDRRLYAEVVDK